MQNQFLIHHRCRVFSIARTQRIPAERVIGTESKSARQFSTGLCMSHGHVSCFRVIRMVAVNAIIALSQHYEITVSGRPGLRTVGCGLWGFSSVALIRVARMLVSFSFNFFAAVSI
jgi:hypothetical protein